MAHADPGSDYPGALIAFGATICLSSSEGSREIAAENFFTGLFDTAKEQGEIVTAVKVPVASSSAYAKFPNPASRYAVVGVGVSLKVENGTCQSIKIGVTGAADHAYRALESESILNGSELEENNIEKGECIILYPKRIFCEYHDIYNKVLISNARRKYLAGELSESCDYYEQAKMNGYKAPNLSWELKLQFIIDPVCFIF